MLAPVTCSPSLGYIPPGATKDIVLTSMSDKPLQLKAAQANIKATQIKPAPGAAHSDWDNRALAGASASPEPKVDLANPKEAPLVSAPLKVVLGAAHVLWVPCV